MLYYNAFSCGPSTKSSNWFMASSSPFPPLYLDTPSSIFLSPLSCPRTPGICGTATRSPRRASAAKRRRCCGGTALSGGTPLPTSVRMERERERERERGRGRGREGEREKVGRVEGNQLGKKHWVVAAASAFPPFWVWLQLVQCSPGSGPLPTLVRAFIGTSSYSTMDLS